ncbi:MAG: transcription-repair coupling factor [Clostridia bacterium]|nr:transcription-repair coupling factor [Clostridia bacterium]
MTKTDFLRCLYEPMEKMDSFQDLSRDVQKGGLQLAYGLDDCQRIHMLCALQGKIGRTLMVVASNDMAAQKIADDMNSLLGGHVAFFPAREISFQRVAASSREITLRRLDALGRLITGQLKAIVAPADALMYRLMPADLFRQNLIRFEEGQILDPHKAIEMLVAAGYERVDVVESRGQCAIRGGILDVYPVGRPNALRIEFFDDEIDSLRDFDVMTQRSIERAKEAILFPAADVLITPEMAEKAADRLDAELDKASGLLTDKSAETQKKLEEEFDLIPFEEFFQLTQDAPMEEMPSMWEIGSKTGAKSEKKSAAKPAKQERPVTPLVQNFQPRIDALREQKLPMHLSSEALIPALYEHTDTLADYEPGALIVFDQPDRLRERCENRMLEFEEHYKTALSRGEALPLQAELLYSWDMLCARLQPAGLLALQPFLRSIEGFKPTGLFKFEGLGASAYQSNMHELVRDIKKWVKDGWRIAILAGGVARGNRLHKSLFDLDCMSDFYEEAPADLPVGQVAILSTSISRGFLYPEIKLAVVAEGDIFGVSKQKSRAKARSGEKVAAFTDLRVGDYVVHENHGVGQYMGTVRLASEGTYRDFLHIRYAGSDKLYVPTDQLDRVQKYIGSEGESPKLNKLSGGEWQKQKAKVKASIQEIAGELVKLYAARASVQGYAFSPDTPWQRQFEDAFEYEETPDQEQAIAEIKADMEQPKVMDRLLCGDVGYGKTEVAIRAIFKCIMDGKQAALLAPTTILVQQHFQTLMKRFGGYPIKVDNISRFRTANEQKQVIEDLKEGKIDVVVGTHRLLGKDIDFKNLGLLVVDEEQRFGVKHKEGIKQLKKTVDVLTLSATPIPRTLHMSMVGIRDMSLLQTPPEERYPVQTYVVEYSDGLVRDAILRELSRGGQVYVLYNRVQSIEVMHTRLKKLVPEARIAIGHGQMREHALEDVMLDFYEGKYDVLLCTTIIEAGLDVPRANTLIVCDADRFGLSQLYQLRGRVGRSNRLAYAYLTVSPNRVLTETADKRLAAIREFTEFGSGFRVAMRDLEIRGTGNLLGSEQSGHMASVGYDLYVKMIEETVRELRGDVQKGDITTKVELHVDAFLPQDYVSSDLVRVEMYKKIASIYDEASRDDLMEELIDRFGDPTRPVINLVDIAHLKGLCSRIGIDLVTSKPGGLVMRFSQSADLKPEYLISALHGHERNIRLAAGSSTQLIYSIGLSKKTDEELLQGAVPLMEDIVKKIMQEQAKDGQGAVERAARKVLTGEGEGT